MSPHSHYMYRDYFPGTLSPMAMSSQSNSSRSNLLESRSSKELQCLDIKTVYRFSSARIGHQGVRPAPFILPSMELLDPVSDNQSDILRNSWLLKSKFFNHLLLSNVNTGFHTDGLAPDCGDSIAYTLDLPQSCTVPLIIWCHLTT